MPENFAFGHKKTRKKNIAYMDVNMYIPYDNAT